MDAFGRSSNAFQVGLLSLLVLLAVFLVLTTAGCQETAVDAAKRMFWALAAKEQLSIRNLTVTPESESNSASVVKLTAEFQDRPSEVWLEKQANVIFSKSQPTPTLSLTAFAFTAKSAPTATAIRVAETATMATATAVATAQTATVSARQTQDAREATQTAMAATQIAAVATRQSAEMTQTAVAAAAIPPEDRLTQTAIAATQTAIVAPTATTIAMDCEKLAGISGSYGGDRLPPGWTILYEDPNRRRQYGGGLQILAAWMSNNKSTAYNTLTQSLPLVKVDYEVVASVRATPQKGKEQRLLMQLAGRGSYDLEIRYGDKGPEIQAKESWNLTPFYGGARVTPELGGDIYLRITRTGGNLLTSWYSYDGQNWTFIHETNPMPGVSLDGLVIRAFADPADQWPVTIYSIMFQCIKKDHP